MWFWKYKTNEKEISPSKYLKSSRQDRQIYLPNYNTSWLLYTTLPQQSFVKTQLTLTREVRKDFKAEVISEPGLSFFLSVITRLEFRKINCIIFTALEQLE